jgi:aminotransferase
MISKYMVCARCIMDTSDIEIKFNDEGICNHCTNALEMLNYFATIRASKKITLEGIVSELKKSSGIDGYHAIIGVSGGVDSSYLLHLLRDSGLKLLAVHVDAGWNSIESVRNINSLVTSLGIDLETIVIDWDQMKRLQVAYLRAGLSNQDVPQDHAFFASLFYLAKKYRIRNVLTGSNFATESILPRSWGQDAMDGVQVKNVFDKYGLGKLDCFPIVKLSNLYFHQYIRKSYVKIAPLNYVEYSKEIAINELREHYGWKDYGGKHKESRFTDYFQEIYLPSRFNVDKKRAHLSSLIINGELSRSEALAMIETSKINVVDKRNLEQYIATKLEVSLADLSAFKNQPVVDPSQFKNQAFLTKLIVLVARSRNFIRIPLAKIRNR